MPRLQVREQKESKTIKTKDKNALYVNLECFSEIRFPMKFLNAKTNRCQRTQQFDALQNNKIFNLN